MPALGKVVLECVALYVIGRQTGVLVGSHLADAGLLSKPAAYNLASLVVTVIWLGYALYWYRSQGQSLWVWGKPTFSKILFGIALVLVFIVFRSRGGGLTAALPRVTRIIQPTESIALDFCFLGPLQEEVFWRGFVLRRLATLTGFWPALVISSVAFGLVHPPGSQALASGLGAYLGFLFSPEGSGQLIIPVVLHIIQNITSIIPSGFFPPSVPPI